MSAPLIGAIAPDIKVNGTALGAAQLEQLTALRVKRSFGLPSRATLRFDDIGYAIAAGSVFAIGTSVEVTMGDGTSLFNGEVTGIDLQLDRGVPDFVVIADDFSYKMTLANKVQSYTKMKFSDIVSKIAANYGLTTEIDATDDTFDYTLQVDSDFGFLSEVADRTGYDWWVEGKQLKFKKPAAVSGPTLTVGEDLRQFSVRGTTLHPGETKVTGWAPQTKQALVGQAATASNGLLPTAALVTPFAKPSALASNSLTTSSVSGPVVQSEAQSLAARAVTRWATGAVTARGITLANAGVKLGVSVTIAGAGPASGSYVVSEVEHTYNMNGFETRFVAGDRRPSGLVDTLSGGAKNSSFRRDGLVVGVVTQVGNSQGSPGDIKVKYPGVDDQLASGWARMVSPGGGNNRGLTFVPEVNDEVVVGFENGDPRRPVILGALFNGKDAQPAFVNSGGTVASRQITSRLGHTVEFGDGTSPQDQYIALTLAGGATAVTMSKQEFVAKVPSGIPMTLSAGNSSIKIGNDGSITIQGSKITLKADTDVEISGLNVTAKASVKSSVSGAMVEVKANAQLDMSASGPAMLKGNPVMVN